MKITLFRSDLEAARACGAGLQFFDALVAHKKKRDRLTVTWTPLHGLWLAVGAPGFSAWLRDQGLIPTPNLRSANLGGADLGGANLRSANLYGANLRSADLGGANLGGANLYGADLRSADLGGANLGGCRIPRGQTPPDGWLAVDDSCSCCSVLRKAVDNG